MRKRKTDSVDLPTTEQTGKISKWTRDRNCPPFTNIQKLAEYTNRYLSVVDLTWAAYYNFGK